MMRRWMFWILLLFFSVFFIFSLFSFLLKTDGEEKLKIFELSSCKNPSKSDGKRWKIIKAMLSLFSSLSVPYILSDGSLLHLYRNCSTGRSDLDFAIRLNWWRNNSELLQKELEMTGFKRELSFGSLNLDWGYSEAWMKWDIKVDLIGNIFKDNYSVTPLWVNGKAFPCFMKVAQITQYKWLEDVTVHGPYPIEDALLSAYGTNYMQPFINWTWDKDPFMTGYCNSTQQKA